MNRLSVAMVRFCLITLCSMLMLVTGCSSVESHGDSTLLSVVAVSRHGIRSPTYPQATMNFFTQQPQGFPLWPAPADVTGDLSTVGQENAARLGSWYRDFYAPQGILPAKGTCPAAGTVFFYADLNERTIQTAQGYRDGMFQSDATPGCGVPVNQSELPVDPYLETARAGKCAIDTKGDLVAFNAKIGGDPSTLVKAYSSQIQTLQAVTQCCQLAACVTTDNPTPTSCSLLELGTAINSKGNVAFASGSLFDVADTVTEVFELEYAQGMPNTLCATTSGAECVGWGAIAAGEIQDMSKLHVLNMVDLTCHLPSYQQVGSTNVMWQLVGTMDQTLSGKSNAEILAPAASKFTLFVAHDENVSVIAGFLGGMTWSVDGFEPNDPAPAGALVFELRKKNQGGDAFVRAYYVAASLDQMRQRTTLTLDTPPQRIALPIPACGGQVDCPYEQFKSFVNANIEQKCLVTTAVKSGQ